MFCRPSPFVAAEPSWSASRCLAMPSAGMRITLEIASPIPTQLCSGRSSPRSERTDSIATYGASRKNWIATSFCARVSAVAENIRCPVKRQTMIRLAKPSIALSRPKPTSAIEPATTPAAIATPPSTAIHPRLSHERVRTRRASRR